MKRALGLLVFLPLIWSVPAFSLSVLQLNLAQLTDLSDKVFAGKCVSVVQERDGAGRPVQAVTYKVKEMLKGAAADQVTFRQLGFTDEEGDRQEIGDVTVMGVLRELPHYEVGEEDVVFLSGEGRLGLTAPVGLMQGKFDVIAKASGQKAVVNGTRNQGLFLGWSKSPKLKTMKLSTGEKSVVGTSGGELSYDDFISLVKKIATP